MFEENKPYQVLMKRNSGLKNFVGYCTYFKENCAVVCFRVGTDTRYVISVLDVIQKTELSPQIIETRKTNGRFFIY
jgi:hypothetical protein